MTDETIFNKSDDPQADNAEPTDQKGEADEKGKQEESPANDIPVKDWIGEGKKYKSVDDALESLPHKESFIEQLKRENEELRGKLEGASTVDDILNQISSSSKEEEAPQQEQQEQYQLKQEDIAKIIDSRISEREQQQTAQQNAATVVDKMTELYGDRAEEVYNQRAEELNVPVEWLNETAKRSPNAVFELFGVGKKEKASPSKLSSSYNSEALSQKPQQKEHRTIMWGASTSDIMDTWRSAKPQQ